MKYEIYFIADIYFVLLNYEKTISLYYNNNKEKEFK